MSRINQKIIEDFKDDILAEVRYEEFLTFFRTSGMSTPEKEKVLSHLNSQDSRKETIWKWLVRSNANITKLFPPFLIQHNYENLLDRMYPRHIPNYHLDPTLKQFCYIVNIEKFDRMPERLGSSVDFKDLTTLWRYLGFEVVSKTNLTKMQMKELVAEMKLKVSQSTVVCFAVFIMTHGKKREDGSVDLEFSDGGLISSEWIIREVSCNNDCYIGQPKLFFFQCCRGDLNDCGFLEKTSTDGLIPPVPYQTESSVPFMFPFYRDVFVAFPCPMGIRGNRDIHSGAWFIQAIVKVFFKYAQHLTFMQLMDKVSESLLQITSSSKDVGFNIGAFEKRGLDKDFRFNITKNVNAFLVGDEHKVLREKLEQFEKQMSSQQG